MTYNDHQAQLAEEIRLIQEAAERATGYRRVTREPAEASKRWKGAGLAGTGEEATEED